MKYFNNIKIINKLLLSFSLVSILLARVGFISWSNMGTINEGMSRMYKKDLLPLDQIGRVFIIKRMFFIMNTGILSLWARTQKFFIDSIEYNGKITVGGYYNYYNKK